MTLMYKGDIEKIYTESKERQFIEEEKGEK